jgi:hypothetical protein
MAGASWTAWFKIKDINAQATLGNLTDASTKLADAFTGKLLKSFNVFNLMKEAIMAVVKGAQELVNESKEIITMSTRFDIPINKLGQLRQVAKSFGMDANGLGGAMSALEKSINNAITRPGMDASRTLQKLGFSQQEIISWSGRTDVAFEAINARLRKFGDEGERSAAVSELYAGNGDAVVDMLKRSKEAADGAASGAYVYSDALTKNNSETLDALDEINEDLKPIYAFVAALAGVIVQILAIVVQGAKMFFGVVVDVIMGLVEIIIGSVKMAIQAASSGLSWLVDKGQNLIGLLSDEEMEQRNKERESEMLKSMETNGIKHGAARMVKGFDPKDVKNMESRLLKGGASVMALGESLGMEGTKEAAETELKELKLQQEVLADQARRQRELIEQKRKDGKDTANDLKVLYGIQDSFNKKKEEQLKLEKQLRELQLAPDEKGDVRQDSNAVEDMREADRLKKQGLALDRERIMLEGGPQIAKDMLEARVATEKQVTAEKELAKLQLSRMTANERSDKYADLEAQGFGFTDDEKAAVEAGGFTSKRDEARENELENKAEESAQARMRAEMKVNQWAKEQNKVISDADRDRQLSAIDAVRERERYADKIKGVSAIDQQTKELEFQIEGIKREEEKLAIMEQNPLATHAEKEKQRDVIQKKTFGAAGEMDKLMAMQYNFVSSNAAKAGMGGGISETNNLIDINKSQLDYLKKLYEAVLASSGQSGKSFQYYPLQLQGRNIKD